MRNFIKRAIVAVTIFFAVQGLWVTLEISQYGTIKSSYEDSIMAFILCFSLYCNAIKMFGLED